MSATATGHDEYDPVTAWYTVSVLYVAYVLAFVDRTILTLLVAPVRADLHISDTQVSLLHGFAFAIFYTLLGIPIARLADSGNRRNIVAAGIFAWSLACAACGLARNFWQLFLSRIGVGIGEAGLTPAAYSMLADLFPQRRLGLAVGVYTSALYMGAGLALIIGGAVIRATGQLAATHWPYVGALHAWQLTFIAVGMPGLLIGIWASTLKEPKRRRTGGELESVTPPLRDCAGYFLLHRRAYGGYILGFSLISVAYNVAVAWGPTYLIRRLALTAPQAGYTMGAVILIAGIGGVITGGWLTDRWRRRGHLDAALRVGLCSAAGAAPSGVIAFHTLALHPFLAWFGVLLFATSMAFGAAAAGLQLITPNRMRAQASALYLLVLNLLAVGVGPTLTAVLTDRFFHDDAAVGGSIAIMIGISAPLAWMMLQNTRAAFTKCATAPATAQPLIKCRSSRDARHLEL